MGFKYNVIVNLQDFTYEVIFSLSQRIPVYFVCCRLGGSTCVIFTYAIEFLPMKNRGRYIISVTAGFSAGLLIVAGEALEAFLMKYLFSKNTFLLSGYAIPLWK